MKTPAEHSNAIPDDGMPAVRFRATATREEEELDMTPMVDVTFLLLIFFMVTAAFSLQKSIAMPPPDPERQEERARTIQEIEEDTDYVIVQIDKDNAIWVGDSEAPSEQDLLVKLRAARAGGSEHRPRGPTKLLVLADTGCRCETVVQVLDAGNAIGFESLRLAKVDEDDF
ncbi:MAG: biopolymer transporter ExbD [Patescibacteria group bacterium]|nr:biopolymer transporter ExbD [Patescibacteria group bacterium]